MRTAIRNLLAAYSPRNPRRSSTRLRPALRALEDRRLLSKIVVHDPIVVDNPTDAPVKGEIDLRQAIDEANTLGGANTIKFSSLFNTPQTITLKWGQLKVTDNDLTIQGPARGVTVDGDRKSRILAIEENATAEISNLTITGGYESRDYGGGVYNRGTLTLNNCTISGNRSETALDIDYGGGLYNAGGKLNLVNCTVRDNSTNQNGYGGGIANYEGTVNLVNCTIQSNVALEGGGLYNFGRAYLTNCTFVGNSAGLGGGLQNHGDAEVVSCTFAGNYAVSGGGMYLDSSLEMWDTIIAGNRCDDYGPDVDGHVLSGGPDNPIGGHNLIGDTRNSSGWSTARDSTDLTNVYAPGLEQLAPNGGPTLTVALDPSSPAIGKGIVVSYLNFAGMRTPLKTDQRGLPLDTPKPDIGAFQVQHS